MIFDDTDIQQLIWNVPCGGACRQFMILCSHKQPFNDYLHVCVSKYARAFVRLYACMSVCVACTHAHMCACACTCVCLAVCLIGNLEEFLLLVAVTWNLHSPDSRPVYKLPIPKMTDNFLLSMTEWSSMCQRRGTYSFQYGFVLTCVCTYMRMSTEDRNGSENLPKVILLSM